MKNVKAICAATLLALSLSIPAHAGDGHTVGTPAPISGGIGTPTTAPGDTGLTDGAAAVDGDISVLSITDIVWALASMF